MELTLEKRKILELLAREFPNRRAAFAEIINLQAILNLPKGTEHYMSDLHGEYEAFKHILNNCAGVIKEKVALLFGDTLTPAEQAQLCTLIYYPQEELERMKQGGEIPRLLYKKESMQILSYIPHTFRLSFSLVSLLSWDGSPYNSAGSGMPPSSRSVPSDVPGGLSPP